MMMRIGGVGIHGTSHAAKMRSLSLLTHMRYWPSALGEKGSTVNRVTRHTPGEPSTPATLAVNTLCTPILY